MEAAIHLYLDENLSLRIAEQLRRRGIDAVTVRDLGLLGDEDLNHLERATQMGRVLVTTDVDFLRLAVENPRHRGIIFEYKRTIPLGTGSRPWNWSASSTRRKKWKTTLSICNGPQQ